MKTVFIALVVALLGGAYYVSDLSPDAKACQDKGGRYGLDGCWKITMTKISD